MKRYRLSIAFVLILTCLVPSWALAHTEMVTVTVGPFTAHGASYDDRQQALGFSELMMAKFLGSSSTDFEWIDREMLPSVKRELEFNFSSMLGTQSALAMGELAQCDLMVSGSFSGGGKDVWCLTIEIIEPRHADLVVSRKLEMSRTGGANLRLTDKDVERASLLVLDALSEARLTLKRIEDRIVIAPLLFQNEMPGTRLDFLADDIRNGFLDRRYDAESVRFTTLPRASQSIGEIDLSLLGFTQSATNALDLADVYVWGTYSEVYTQGVVFAEVPVVATITLWDGADGHQVFAVTNTVGDLATMVRRIVDETIEHGIHMPEDKDLDTDVRRQMALSMRTYARKVQDLIIGSEDLWNFQSATWLQRWKSAVDLLAVASFVDPTDVELRFELLFEYSRTDILSSYLTRGHWSFSWLLERAQLWSEFCDEFGYEWEMPDRILREWICANDFRQDQLRTAGEICLRSLSNLRDSLANAQNGLPDDVREVLLAQTKLDIAKKKIKFAQETRFKSGRLVKDPLSKIRRPRISNVTNEMCVAKQKNSESQQNGDHLPVHNNEPIIIHEPVLPASISVSCDSVSFLRDFFVRGVESVCAENGCLWVCVSGQKLSTVNGAVVYLYDPTTDVLARLSKLYGRHAMPTSVSAGNNTVWMGLDGDGLWEVDASTLTPRKHSMRDGLVPSHISCLADTDDEIFAAGKSTFGHWIGVLDKKNGGWSHYRSPFLDGEIKPVQITSIAANQKLFAIYCRNIWGGGYNIFICRLDDGTWVDVLEKIQPRYPEIFQKRHSRFSMIATVDEWSAWLVSGNYLVKVSGITGELEQCFRMPSTPTSVFVDGDYLWVACNGARVYVLHRPSMSFCANISIEMNGSAQSMCRIGGKLWIGKGSSASREALVCADVSKVPGYADQIPPWQKSEVVTSRVRTLADSGELRNKFVGTWLCNGIVEELYSDGSFVVRREGKKISDGRWEIENQNIVWYSGGGLSHPKRENKDINPILAINEDTFVLMEMNQTITRHIRKSPEVK